MLKIMTYKLPIKGTALNDIPLTGDDVDPISVIPLDELPGRPLNSEGRPEDYCYTCLEYNPS